MPKTKTKTQKQVDGLLNFEVADRSGMVADLIEHALAGHPVVKSNPEMKKEVERAQDALVKLAAAAWCGFLNGAQK